MRQALVLAVTALASGAGGAEVAPALSAKVAAAFDGHFRAGCPVLLRVAVRNGGPAVEGTLDLVVEGLTYRQAVRVGTGTTATVEVLAAVHVAVVRARVVLSDGAGKVLLDHPVDVALRGRDDGKPVIAVVGESKPAAERVAALGGVAVAVPPDALASASAAYLAVDAVMVAGDGAGIPPPARRALADWLRGGGRAAFALEADALVQTESLLAELGGCAGRPTASEWLRAVAESRRMATWDAVTWRVGLGRVVAGLVSEQAFAAVLAPQEGTGWDLSGSPELYAQAPAPPWGASARWRLTGATIGLLAAVAALAFLVPRRWGRGRRAACVVGAAALCAAVAWALVVPSGRGALETAGLVEGVQGESEGRRSELVWLTGAGRGQVTLQFGQACAVVPLYYLADEAGSWRDVVVARDATGRWSLTSDVRDGLRRCFLVWWPWGRLEAATDAPPQLLVRDGRFATDLARPAWEPLRQLRLADKAQQSVLTWQARRTPGRGRLFGASWGEAGQSRVQARGLLSRRDLPVLLWVERPDAR